MSGFGSNHLRDPYSLYPTVSLGATLRTTKRSTFHNACKQSNIGIIRICNITVRFTLFMPAKTKCSERMKLSIYFCLTFCDMSGK